MLKDGEKGVIRQRNSEEAVYAIAPHIPCGIINAEQLRKIADAADKYDLTLKITSAARIALFGIQADQVDAIWNDLELTPGFATGLCVRSIKTCPGTEYCRLARQDSIKMGMELDKLYNGMSQPNKIKIGVSGCKIQCAENCIKDIALYGTQTGWTVSIGGNGSVRPRLADILTEDISYDAALSSVKKIIDFYKTHSKRERMGRMIDRIGLDNVKQALLN
jgi:NAD(P)H-nitrite reductase large subunit